MIELEKDFDEGLRLPAFLGLLAQVGVTAFPAPFCPDGVASATVHADLFIKKPGVGLFEACHINPPAWKLRRDINRLANPMRENSFLGVDRAGKTSKDISSVQSQPDLINHAVQ
jgi:hypothetical protein